MKLEARLSGLLLLLLPFFAGGCSTAEKQTASPVPVVQTKYAPEKLPFWAVPYFLTALPPELDDVIPPPPGAGSNEEKKDVAELERWQKKRKTTDCDWAKSQQIPTLDGTFGFSPERKEAPNFKKLDPQTYQQLKGFFDHVQNDVAFVALEQKERFRRPRPYDAHSQLVPCIKREGSLSYPSAHAAYGTAGAVLLSELFPKYETALKKSGERVGVNRLVGGVHYPSDVAYGSELGRKTLEVLRKNPKFASELEALKKKLTSAKSEAGR